MSYYTKLKKLDLESAEQMQEATGPSDECLCSILAPPEDGKRSIAGSIKKALASIGGSSRSKKRTIRGGGGVDIPLTFAKGGKGIFTTKQEVQRTTGCGKCGCDRHKYVLKHSDMKIKIISPDVSSICPCPNDCLPNKTNLANNIKVTVEHMKIDPDLTDSENSLNNFPKEINEQLDEPDLPKLSVTDLINSQFDMEEIEYNENNDNDDTSQWSFGDHQIEDDKALEGEFNNDPKIEKDKLGNDFHKPIGKSNNDPEAEKDKLGNDFHKPIGKSNNDPEAEKDKLGNDFHKPIGKSNNDPEAEKDKLGNDFHKPIGKSNNDPEAEKYKLGNDFHKPIGKSNNDPEAEKDKLGNDFHKPIGKSNNDPEAEKDKLGNDFDKPNDSDQSSDDSKPGDDDIEVHHDEN